MLFDLLFFIGGLLTFVVAALAVRAAERL